MEEEVLIPIWSKPLSALASVRRRAERSAVNAEGLRKDMLKLFEEADREVGKIGDDSYQGLHREAKYAVTVLADELAIHAPWSDIEIERWRDRILELEFFGMNLGGDEFFVRADALLQNNRGSEREVREIYLMCLLLGFRGRYRHDEEEMVKEYVERLYESIDAANPSRVCKDAYTHLNVSEGEGLNRRQWVMAMVFVVFAAVCLFAMSALMTKQSYERLGEAADELRTVGTQGGDQ